MHHKREIGMVLTLAAMITAPAAQAHSFGADGAGFLAGLSHPALGLDHLFAMLAVGLWAAQQGGRAVWRLPLAFATMMIVGAALALTGLALPAVEVGIATSVVVLGLLLAAAVPVAPLAGLVLVGIFALFHGHAHAAEMPQTASPLLYAVGFSITTAVLQLVGGRLGSKLRSAFAARMIRLGGGAVAVSGLLLWS